ncbi:DUF3307 domain-containing protein [Candidatus Falkowbacteria bacterium]|nr:DUF3307 domain-containing protein [Candidatus Falkowbacteria bacterium]
MADLFIRIILGHLIGDYLLQSKKQAINKTEPGLIGLAWSLWHCLLYTGSVCLMMWDFRPSVALLVFLSHWPIDRFCLGDKWLRMIGGRDLYAIYYSGEKYAEVEPSTIIGLSFGCVVYTVVDNTLHLLLLWIFMCLFF